MQVTSEKRASVARARACVLSLPVTFLLGRLDRTVERRLSCVSARALANLPSLSLSLVPFAKAWQGRDKTPPGPKTFRFALPRTLALRASSSLALWFPPGALRLSLSPFGEGGGARRRLGSSWPPLRLPSPPPAGTPGWNEKGRADVTAGGEALAAPWQRLWGNCFGTAGWRRVLRHCSATFLDCVVLPAPPARFVWEGGGGKREAEKEGANGGVGSVLVRFAWVVCSSTEVGPLESRTGTVHRAHCSAMFAGWKQNHGLTRDLLISSTRSSGFPTIGTKVTP